MSFSALRAVAYLALLGSVCVASAGDRAAHDPDLSLGDPSTGFSCGYSVASGGQGTPRNSTIDTYANYGFGLCVSQLSGVTVTKELVSGRQAVVASKRVTGPIADSTRTMFRRAGYTQYGETYFCHDTHYLLQPTQRFCFNLLPPL